MENMVKLFSEELKKKSKEITKHRVLQVPNSLMYRRSESLVIPMYKKPEEAILLRRLE